MYPIVKHIHIILAFTSITLFQFRYWFYQIANHAPPKAMKLLPHSIDTLLMVTGISLALWAGFSPLQVSWLLYKLLALLIYISFGMLAMKQRGPIQWFSYGLATLAVVYMIMAATQKSAIPDLSYYFL